MHPLWQLHCHEIEQASTHLLRLRCNLCPSNGSDCPIGLELKESIMSTLSQPPDSSGGFLSSPAGVEYAR